MTLPLADVRVIAVEQYGAGPWGTLQLADLGAEVIKIEDPQSRGDVGRYVPPYRKARTRCSSRRSTATRRAFPWTFAPPAAARCSRTLWRKSDAVYSNLRGDQPHGLGLTYEDLRDINPRIVCCSLSGFGMTGPRAARGGLRLHHAGDGRLDEPHRRSRRPADQERAVARRPVGRVRIARSRCSAGLWRARRDGVGCDCDISLYETALHELMYLGDLDRERRLRAASECRTRRTRRSCPSRHSRPPTAGSRSPAPSRSSGSGCASHWGARTSSTTRASPTSPRATATARSCCRSLRDDFVNANHQRLA